LIIRSNLCVPRIKRDRALYADYARLKIHLDVGVQARRLYFFPCLMSTMCWRRALIIVAVMIPQVSSSACHAHNNKRIYLPRSNLFFVGQWISPRQKRFIARTIGYAIRTMNTNVKSSRRIYNVKSLISEFLIKIDPLLLQFLNN